MIGANTVLTRQSEQSVLWLPDQLDREVDAVRTAGAHFETVVVFEHRTVMFIDTRLQVQLGRYLHFQTCSPDTDRPAIPVITRPNACLGGAERQILEIAGEALEVFAW
ncbi:hypothetical protein D3C75_945210 [compost metagenome]